MRKKIAILVGGSDLFSGFRGISRGTRIIRENITPYYDEIIVINYNYFLDFGRSFSRLAKLLEKKYPDAATCMYGYSKGGEVVLKLCRHLKSKMMIDLLITIDIANGPWSDSIDRNVPGNVKKNINVYQGRPRLPLMSYGVWALSDDGVDIQNINLTNQVIQNQMVTHSNIELLMAEDVIKWMQAFAAKSE